MYLNPYYSFAFFAFLIVLYFSFAWRTYLRYLRAVKTHSESEVPLRYFTWYFMWMGIFFIFHWTPIIALYIGGPYSNYEWFKISHPWSHLMGHIFMHISFMFAALVGAHFSWPKLKPYFIAWIAIVAIFIGTIVTILHPQTTEIIGPVMTGGDSGLVAFFVACGALGILYTGLVFLWQAFKTHDKNLRIRSALISIGMILFFFGGPMNDAAGTVPAVLRAYFVVVLGVILQAIGILMKGSDLQPTLPPQPSSQKPQNFKKIA